MAVNYDELNKKYKAQMDAQKQAQQQAEAARQNNYNQAASYQPQEQRQTTQNGMQGASAGTMQGVSAGTQQGLQKAQQGYQQGDAVTNAQNMLAQIQAQKPQGYTSKYEEPMNQILQEIQNPGQFKYEFNGDNLFNAYKDLYTEKAKQASLDAQGQAAGLTGGYGSSYGQAVGTQMYQQNLLPLYDKGLELYDRAYQAYQDELAGKKDIYNILSDADERGYGRYRDTVGDWQREEENAYERMGDERDFDYGTYMDLYGINKDLAGLERGAYESDRDYDRDVYENERDYAEDVRRNNRDFAEDQRKTNLDENYRNKTLNRSAYENDRDYDRSIYENDRDFAENQRLNDRNYDRDVLESDRNYQLNVDKMTEDNRRYAQEYYMNLAEQMLANGEMPPLQILIASGIGDEETARKLMKQLQAGGGSGNGGNKNGNGDDNNKYYIDDNGNEYYYEKDENGNRVKKYKKGSVIEGWEDPWYREAEYNGGLNTKETTKGNKDYNPLNYLAENMDMPRYLTEEQKEYLKKKYNLNLNDLKQ